MRLPMSSTVSFKLLQRWELVLVRSGSGAAPELFDALDILIGPLVLLLSLLPRLCVRCAQARAIAMSPGAVMRRRQRCKWDLNPQQGRQLRGMAAVHHGQALKTVFKVVR